LPHTIRKQGKLNFVRTFGDTIPNWETCQDGGDDSDNASESDTLIAKGTCAQKIYQEKKDLARVKLGTYKKYFAHGGGIMIISLICVLFIGAQLSKTLIHKLEAKWLVLVSTCIMNYYNSSLSG
jgi:hypothetical protein